jgi:peptidoglycan/LPS O-acetylase OafA/YrhL
VSDTVAVDASSARRPTLGHVAALDGVRALAVAAVVLYHGGVSVRGGYLGVDVFFVLSGFLITSLLLVELERDGRLAFGRFYERRARRLLPGLVVLVALVCAYAMLAVPGGSLPSLPGQIVGTMAYVGNWTLIASHATYFTQGLPPSPLQHTWSLAIEEQFYLVWPVLLFGLRRLTRRRDVLAVLCVLGSLGCAAFSAVRFSQGAGVNGLYFATQTHATTMLLGAAAACVLLRRAPKEGEPVFHLAPASSRRAGNVAGVAAWALVIAGLLTISGTGAALYRGGYVVVGAVTAAAIAATVWVPDGWSARVLSLRPVTYVGRISYGIYLYHFPLFLWLDHAHTGLDAAPLLGVRLAATLALAAASYAWIERPVRERRVLTGMTGLAGAVAGFVAVAAVAATLTSSAATIPFADHVAKRSFEHTAPRGTTTTVLLVGDSMAQTLGDGLDNPLSNEAQVYFAVNGVENCSLVGGRMRIKDFHVLTPRRCNVRSPRGWPVRWRRLARRLHPALSMLLFRLDLVDHRVGGRWSHVGDPSFDCVLRARLVRAAAALAATGRPVVLLTTPYYDSGEQPSGATWPEDDPARVRAYNAILRSVASSFPGVVHVVDLNAWVSPSGAYARTIGRTVVRWVDGVHFTYGGDAFVQARILRAVGRLAATTPSPHALAALDAAAGGICGASTTGAPAVG